MSNPCERGDGMDAPAKETEEGGGHFGKEGRPMHGSECPQCKKVLEDLPFPDERPIKP